MTVRSKHRRYTRRVQTVLTEEQYALLVEVAREQGKPLSVLVREAIEEGCFQEALRRRRRQALKSLLALKAPVADWEEMEAEIARGASEAGGRGRGKDPNDG